MNITKQFAGVNILVKALLHTTLCQKLWQTTTILFDRIAGLRLQGILGYSRNSVLYLLHSGSLKL